MSQHLEEIRLKLSIEDLVGSYVQLKKAGRNLKGLCPFHGEKTPSFMVSPEKGIAYCFGCHQGGDIFKFTELVEKISFQEAVRLLADKVGVRLPKQSPQEYNKRLRVIEVNQATTAFYQDQLKKYPEHQSYFLNRGMTPDSIQHFQLGYAPDSFNQLKDCLVAKGFDMKELLEAAVISQRSISDQNTYDRFRHRLIFPIFDHQGNPVGFSGRIIGEGEPKYLNSPDTPSYNKSLTLYGLNLAKEAIKQQDAVIFVEGYMDVISTHIAGTKNTVATCGTAITPQQLKLVQRYTKNVVFAFDQDSAGMEATFRAVELAQLADLNIKIIDMKGGKDPDECVQKNPEEWKRAVENPIEVMDFYFNYAFEKFDIQSIEGVKQSLQFLLPLIKTYKTDVERGYYLNQLAVHLKTDVKLLWSDLNKIKLKDKSFARHDSESSPPSSVEKRIFTREEYLLGLLFSHPFLYAKISNELIEDLSFSNEAERFYKALKKVYTRESLISVEKVKAELSESADQEAVDIYALLADERYSEFSDEILEKEAFKLIKDINRQNFSRQKRGIKFQIQSLNKLEDQKVLLEKYIQLLKLENKI